MVTIERQYKLFDIFLLLLVVGISIFGIVLIGSATQISDEHIPDIYARQRIFVVTGIIVLFVMAFVDYQFICKFYIAIYFFNLMLLGIVLMIPTETHNVARWINLGFFTIQPSEFTKIFMIIALAKFIDKKNEKINNIPVILLIFIITLIPVILIQQQPSLSASLVTLVVMVVMLFIGGLNYKYILITLIIIAPVVVIFLYDLALEEHIFLDRVLREYQLNRLYAWRDPESFPDIASQTTQSIQALASGQLTGRGIRGGIIHNYRFVPLAENDFIFAVVGEEFGFIGAFFVLLTMLLIILRCLVIAHKSADNLGKLLATGIGTMIAFQTFVNVCVATGILPNTGMPFPFLSSGGSSLWVNMASIGLVINIGMSKQKSIFEG